MTTKNILPPGILRQTDKLKAAALRQSTFIAASLKNQNLQGGYRNDMRKQQYYPGREQRKPRVVGTKLKRECKKHSTFRSAI
jgi:hypothetical protein